MTRPTVLKFAGITLPHVHTIQRGYDALADVGRTAGGALRSDTVRVWRSWSIGATAPAAVVDQLLRHLHQTMWQAAEFWTLDMGEEISTTARIDPSSWRSEIVLGRPDWRTVAFTVMEQ